MLKISLETPAQCTVLILVDGPIEIGRCKFIGDVAQCQPEMYGADFVIKRI